MIETTTVGLIQETQCQWFEPKRLRALLLTVDGAGSGIDADKLDGQEGAYYLPAASYTAADILTKIKTVDGAGSGLDADLLDGSSSAAFATSGHNHAATYVDVAGDTMTGSLVINGSNTISAGAGTNSAHVMGQGTIGNVGFAGFFALAATAYATTANYMIMQNGAVGTGDTFLNAPTGRGVYHRINNADVMVMSSTGLRIGSGTAPSYTLDVSGTMRVSGNIGFYNTTPVARPAAYTQTYATATRTHSNITAATPSAYAAGANGYSTGAKASEVHAAVVAHQTDIANIKQVLNQVIDDLQAFGLLQ